MVIRAWLGAGNLHLLPQDVTSRGRSQMFGVYTAPPNLLKLSRPRQNGWSSSRGRLFLFRTLTRAKGVALTVIRGLLGDSGRSWDHPKP